MADTGTAISTITLAAHDAGICVIPIRDDGSKRPPITWEQYQHERPSREQVEQWFGPHRAAAAICGPVSGGLIMLEMEGDDYAAGRWSAFRDAAIARLGEDRWREVVACVELSPSGGPHLFIRCTETTIGNLKLARRKTGPTSVEVIMETRGRGGYTVIAGSVGHSSGKAWISAQGTYADIATVTAVELEAILDAARTLDEMPTPAPPRIVAERPRTTLTGDSVFDKVVEDFNRRTSWEEVLSGFAEWLRESGGISYWHRIGSDNEQGMTTNAKGTDTLIVFSSSTPFEQADGVGPAPSYDRFSAEAILRHDGDRTAAFHALRAQGYGPPAPERPAKTATRVSPPPLTAVSIPPTEVDPETGEIDDEPIPLGNPLGNLPDFPIHVLPPWMAEEAEAAADAIQVPVEMTAFLGIMALSICLAGKVEVDAINWRQPLNIYGAITAPTGTGKSPASERMLAPLRELEVELAKATADLVAYSEAEATSHANAVAEAEKALKGDPGSVTLISALADARATFNEHRVLSPYRLTIDDHTPEALSMAIASQTDERIAVISPEGGSLFESMTGTRYQQPNKTSNVPDVYLKSWGGEQISVDRVGRSALIIRRPILSVCVMVQPEVIHALSASPMVARQGGLARFLWVAARNLVGQRDRKRRRHAAPPSPVYADNLIRIGRWASGLERGAVVLQATEEAADVVDNLAEQREARMGLGGDLEAHIAIEAKMLAYHWRLAALLAIAHDDRGDLTAQRTEQAAELVEFFMAHATAIHSAAGLDEHAGPVKKVAGYLLAHAGEELDWKDFRSKMRSAVDNFADLVPTLEQFVAMRWLIVHEGDLTTLGVQGAPNSLCIVNARLRANFHGA